MTNVAALKRDLASLLVRHGTIVTGDDGKILLTVKRGGIVAIEVIKVLK